MRPRASSPLDTCTPHARPHTEIEGLKRKLTSHLAPTNPALQSPWDVSECAGVFWRPTFDALFYPYLPTHITKPKECKKLFVVPLADKGMFAVRRARAPTRLPHCTARDWQPARRTPPPAAALCRPHGSALCLAAQVPGNMRLVAVPFYELYDNMARYGPVISSIPHLLSRYRLNMAAQALAAPAAQLAPVKPEQQPAQQEVH